MSDLVTVEAFGAYSLLRDSLGDHYSKNTASGEVVKLYDVNGFQTVRQSNFPGQTFYGVERINGKNYIAFLMGANSQTVHLWDCGDGWAKLSAIDIPLATAQQWFQGSSLPKENIVPGNLVTVEAFGAYSLLRDSLGDHYSKNTASGEVVKLYDVNGFQTVRQSNFPGQTFYGVERINGKNYIAFLMGANSQTVHLWDCGDGWTKLSAIDIPLATAQQWFQQQSGSNGGGSGGGSSDSGGSGGSTPPTTPTYTLTPSASSVNEGSALTTSITTTNILSGTTLYYSLSGTGITAADFSSGSLTGSGTVSNSGSFSFSHTLANDLTTEGSETLNIKLFSDASRLQQIGSTASVTIADTSKAVPYIEINKVANHPEIPWWWHNMNENASTVEGTQEFNVVHYGCRNAINVNTTLLKVGNIITVAMDSGKSSAWGEDSLDKNVEGFSVASSDGDDQVTIKLGTDRGESNFSHLELRLFSGRDSVYIDRISLLDNAVTGGNFIDGGDGIDTLTINDTYDNYKLYSSNPIDRNRWELSENRVYRNRFLSSYNSGFTFPDNLRFSDQPAYPLISLFDVEKIIFLDREILLEKTTPTYTLTPSASSISEGKALTTTVNTTNVASGTTLYYSLSGTGISTADFLSGSLTGSGTVSSSGSFSFSHTLANDLTTEGTETLNIKLYSDSSRSTQVGSTASVSINDTSTTLGIPTARTVDNLYAKAMIAGPLIQTNIVGNQINYQFYNIGAERYGIKQKESTRIDEITGLASISISGTTISISQDIQGVFDQVTGRETQDAQAFRLYNAAFARFPDSSGLRYWINEYKSGISNYRTIAQSFINSNEFALRYGANNSNEEFINNMYKNVLGRLPDASGLAYWVGNLNSGADSRVNVLGGFSESAENKILFSQGTGFI